MEWLKKQINIDVRSRMKSYSFWISLASAIVLALTQFGVKVNNEYIMGCVQAVLGIFVLLGLVNNPTTKNAGFGDDQKE